MVKSVKITPTKWVHGGVCLGYHEGKPVFIVGGLPGIESECIIEKETSKIIHAYVEISSDCEVFPKCGGCNYRHISYEQEHLLKKAELSDLLKIESDTIEVLSNKMFGYRNNVQFKSSPKAGIGFYQRHSNSIVDIQHLGCKNLDDKLNGMLSTISSLKKPSNNSHEDLNLKFRLNQNFHGSSEDVIDYKLEISNFSIDDYSFQVPINGFFQTNQFLIKPWLEIIKEKLESKPMPVLELFCGVGSIGQYASSYITKLLGIESSKDSIQFAKTNAEFNKVKNFHYKTMDLYKNFPVIKEGEYPTWIVNPPRAGLQDKVIHALVNLRPQTVIYSSCDPHTLARDWKTIQSLNSFYKISKLYLVDFFPRTKHFETIMILNSK
ncbi:class I SAM-dependent RNA methyltransferase [Leptospira sp. GIMC2001]|uniref:class I SAM-dependent RNA methyltransferase n=1 Tax=Leptospira sp. GIMC2001 TaxID=1513297 RepID=UPI00234B48CF|nr:methyltransferase domain-containing protein [Leptospira sp. GIMC2001]WCL49501.1 methyltransferase [Leptospira sp. GIMC2001]